MRVACIGNMNNNLFSITRYLRDRGLDAHLFLLNNEADHFHPSADTFDLSYQVFSHQLDWGYPRDLKFVDLRAIRQTFTPFDFIIACNTAPAFLHAAGLNVDLILPHGYDLYRLPFPQWSRNRSLVGELLNARFRHHQREGVRKARFITGEMLTSAFGNPIERLGGTNGNVLHWISPYVYEGEYRHIDRFFTQTHWHPNFRRIRESNDLVVFHHNRLIWNISPKAINYKGNDALIRGFARFVKANRDLRAQLVILEYGRDVNATRRLVAELGIEDRVVWFPRMLRKDVMVGLFHSDIVAGQLGHSWLVSSTILEALCMGKPLLHYREDARYDGRYCAELYPLINVKDAEEVAQALERYTADPQSREDLGRRCREWFERYMVGEGVERYVNLIQGRPA